MAEVSLAYFIRILDLIEERGVDRQDCLTAVGIEALPKESPKLRVDAKVANGVFAFAAEKLNRPLLGIRCGRKFRIPKFTKLGNILAMCDNIRQAADVNARYAPLVHTIGQPSGIIKDDSGKDKIRWTPSFSPDECAQNRHILEYVMTNYSTSLDWLAWSSGKGVEVLRLGHDGVTSKAAYEELLDCKVEFSAGEYSVILRDGVAEEPLPTASPAQFALLRARQERILASFMHKVDLVHRVELAIREQIEIEKPSQKSIARKIGMSDRSVRRYLKEENTSFKAIFEDVKKDLAVGMIADGMALSDVAHGLWYSDQPAFTRAYKKWFGVAPSKHKG